MDDLEILGRIERLLDEEHRLRERAGGGDGLGDGDRHRLERVEVALDQCWDLLRQRRGRRRAEQDPEDATARDGPTVEAYEQ